MIRRHVVFTIARVALVFAAIGWTLGRTRCVEAEVTPRQAVYWWQDEIREAGFALSVARTGEVAQWPRMRVAAGSAVMPVAPAAGPIQPDGRLEEAAWQQASRFPVGPVFDTWRAGPFMLWLRACRDEKHVYLAIESPRDLTGLGALTPEGELFAVGGKKYHVGPGGNLPETSIGRNGPGHVIELALPVGKQMSVTFAAEVVRRRDGRLPVDLKHLGLGRLAEPGTTRDFRKPALWLDPIGVKLVLADTTARLDWEVDGPSAMRLIARVAKPGKVAQPGRSGAARETLLKAAGKSSVYPYSWQHTAGQTTFSSEGFFHLEPIGETLESASAMVDRASNSEPESGRRAGASLREAIDGLLAKWKGASPADRPVWRDLYCRARELRARAHLNLLDAPLLFVKRHPYFAAHIYDDFYTWHPGGGIYVLDEPRRPCEQPRVRAVIDPSTNETLGAGVYRDPDLSWDAKRLVFAYRPGPEAVTSLYQVGIDGRGLLRLTASEKYNDVTPAFLPDDRIVFTSTRPKALVPCFNSGVDTLHTMNADGSGIRSISSNNVNEFDPAVLPDGRVVYGRWEYVDKTALYMQSLWTMLPDGRMEEALFGNNLAKPTAILDVRAVPGSHAVVASLTPHNGQAVGAIGMIDMDRGKNDLAAVFNFTPEYAIEMDQGLRSGPSDPWPLSADDVLFCNNAIASHGIIELVDRWGNRELVHSDPSISCFAPMLVRAGTRPPVVTPHTRPSEPGKFLVVDVYQGLSGVPRGSVKRLRIVEETARTSGLPPGGRWWNQAFLVSWQGAYIVKNILGTVPVHDDGSAYFEAPPGRALYFELLDDRGLEVQRMRTFVQAAPGTTRSCVGCHESKKSTALQSGQLPRAMLEPPARPEPESWGSGYIDYPTMVQPILDKHCVRCHGGEEGIARGLDFSGGWTWAFNISYETLIKHRMTGFLNCHNSSVHTSELIPPRTIGSGAAPLANRLIERYPQVSQAERDLIFAWMDTNSNYYGTWDYTPHATCGAILRARGALAGVMRKAGCTECHAPGHIGNDWVNLQTPEWSRLLRAPMAQAEGGLGVAMCRKRKARVGYPLIDQRVQPPDVLYETKQPEWDPGGEEHVSIASTDDPHYQAMLGIIRRARSDALAQPRVDMPGAEVVPGTCRLQVAMRVPESAPSLACRLRVDSAAELSWPRTAETIGLQYELHRGSTARFQPDASTQIGLTTAGRFFDLVPPVGLQHYALVVSSGTKQSRPTWQSLEVRRPLPPESPERLTARALPGEVELAWAGSEVPGVRYDVYRATSDSGQFAKQNAEPLATRTYSDLAVEPGVAYAYTVRAVDRRMQPSRPSSAAKVTPLPLIEEPVFVADFSEGAAARRFDGSRLKGTLHAGARTAEGLLTLGSTGFATFEHLREFDLAKPLSVELWVRLDHQTRMPVVAACGAFNGSGWFLQRFGKGWRWHLAPVSCDGGSPVVGRWTHLVGTFDGKRASLYQDGRQVAAVDCQPNPEAWPGPLVVGQYATQAPQYQVQGAITGLTVYRRALRPEEIAEKAAAPPGTK